MLEPVYRHTQRGPIGWVLFVIALAVAVGAIVGAMPTEVRVLLALLSALFVFLSACFQTLTIHDEAAALHVSFGPLSVFQTRIRYSEILKAELATTDLLDGIGIHYIFTRGWVWNLWGRNCIRLETRGGVIRVGTDDPENLLRCVQSRVTQPS
ncbi:MAG: hypothetical protein U0636_07485 [Phycisphaerales bacterium]